MAVIEKADKKADGTKCVICGESVRTVASRVCGTCYANMVARKPIITKK